MGNIMGGEKIEQRLQEEMKRMEKAGEGALEIPVLIEHEGVGSAEPGGLSTLEEKVRVVQQGIRRKLEQLGAGKTLKPMTLANAIEARLTPAGIAEIAELPDVKKIVWNRAERVTA